MPTLPRHQTGDTASDSPNYLRLGAGALGATALSVLAIGPGAKAAANFIVTGDPFHGTSAPRTAKPFELDGPTVTYVVGQGDGAQAIGADVNPEVFSGSGGSAEQSADVTAAIQAQAEGNFLQPGQRVKVPDVNPGILPADPDNPHIIMTK